jgi:hypothetical protein
MAGRRGKRELPQVTHEVVLDAMMNDEANPWTANNSDSAAAFA